MKLLNFITCDEIRQEISGKNTFIGVFENIVINFQETEAWPAAIRLGIYTNVKREAGDKNPNRFEFKIIRNGEEKSSIEGALNFDASKDTFGVILNFNTLLVGGPGALDFKLNILNGAEVLVSLSPNPLQISSQVLIKAD